MYVSRLIEPYILKASDSFPVLLVTGARQVGKTTLLKHLAKENRSYVTLDNPMIRTLAKEDPGLFLQRFRPPVMIDEIQYAPELFPFIKMAVDQDRKPGLFWLIGSQQFHLMKGISESLAGRVAIVELPGFSRREMQDQIKCSEPFLPTDKIIKERLKSAKALTLHELYHTIWRGSFPEIVLNQNMDRNLFFNSYTQTYLQRDIRAITKVGDEMRFLRFLKAAAARTGQLLNYASLARDADISQTSAHRWLSVLQASGLIFLLSPWHSNTTKRNLKSPKLYFTDTGLCSWLLEWSSPKTLEAGALSGHILESWVLGEIVKSYRNNGTPPPIYFYRDRDMREIDLLIMQDGITYPVEIKKTSAPSRRSVKHFSLLEKSGLKVGPGAVICLSEDSIPITENINTFPVAAL
jgi:uncharacterized protein